MRNPSPQCPAYARSVVTRQTVLCTTPFSFGMRKLEESILWHTVCINRKEECVPAVLFMPLLYAPANAARDSAHLELTRRAIWDTLDIHFCCIGTLYAKSPKNSGLFAFRSIEQTLLHPGSLLVIYVLIMSTATGETLHDASLRAGPWLGVSSPGRRGRP